MDKAAKYGQECLRFEFDKVNIFILKIIMGNIKDNKAFLVLNIMKV